MATNFVSGNKLSDTDIQALLNATVVNPQPLIGEDDLAFYRKDAIQWGAVGDITPALKTELEFLASLGVALPPAREQDPWHVDTLTVGDLYRPVGGTTTTGILWRSEPENAKGFLQFLRRTTLPAYVSQAHAITSRLPPTTHDGIFARQQAIAAEGAIRKIENQFVSQP